MLRFDFATGIKVVYEPPSKMIYTIMESLVRWVERKKTGEASCVHMLLDADPSVSHLCSRQQR
ncbi:hypothetical protein KSZ_55760 [Dictyobacter formicarum]|uniref:Uncharacterized protein n=1 Tax=Dictyobacter formicarum TaxID=2778368 RepID=A0ABQ3VP37_9CHLR|nr:hypothetical protein KSZ_55760 [Dictyobacter formicarum]